MRIRARCVLLVLFALTIGRSFLPTIGAPVNQEPTATKNEKREAQELAAAFTKRLGQTRDFGIVMNEFFVADAAERYIAEQKAFAAKTGISDVTLSSGMFLDGALLDQGTPEDWRKLYAASAAFLVLGMLNLARQKADLEKLEATDMYPREVVELLDSEPTLSNLIVMKSGVRYLKTPGEMRHATVVLERANALTRKALPSEIDLETTFFEWILSDSGKSRPISQTQRAKARAELTTPKIDVADSEYYGFPKGTRMMWIRTFAMMDILAVRLGGKLRIVWAHPIAD